MVYNCLPAVDNCVTCSKRYQQCPAFYLFVKSPVEDEKAFCEKAKKQNLLLVPGSSFACPGYVRLAYCVSYEMIVRSLPHFEELMKEYR